MSSSGSLCLADIFPLLTTTHSITNPFLSKTAVCHVPSTLSAISALSQTLLSFTLHSQVSPIMPLPTCLFSFSLCIADPASLFTVLSATS
ncbi:hypothetical protein HD806DRAFT_500968 [Xylariaceae sp. AK1471]|nr:hypothetical protein HD806DRAFT_500968 [Xylariaceae sp. AK1471]